MSNKHASTGLEQISQLLARKFGVTKNLTEQARADGFSSMYWHYSGASVAVSHEMVTTFDANEIEAASAQRCNRLFARNGRKRGHASTVMRCSPTKSRLSGALP